MNRPCDICKNAAPYEAILIDGVDIFKSMPHLCDPCTVIAEREHAQKQRETRIAKAQQLLRDSIPPRMLETDIKHERFNHTAWALIGKEADPHDPRNILLIGQAGLCKSRMLALLCKRAALRGMSIAWITAHDFALLADRYKNYKTRAQAQDELSRLKYIERLVFDDLGKQEWTPAIEEIFFYLVDHRHSHNKPIWFSANTHPQHMLLDGRLSRDRGAAIVGRIVEDAQEFELQPTAK